MLGQEWRHQAFADQHLVGGLPRGGRHKGRRHLDIAEHMLRFQVIEDRGEALLALQGCLIIRGVDQQILRGDAGAGQAEYLLLLSAQRSRQGL